MPEQTLFDVASAFSSLQGQRVLVAEDEYMMAEDLRETLESQGAEVMGPVASVADALELLRSGPAPDLAILDINLGGEMAYPVADAFRAMGTPSSSPPATSPGLFRRPTRTCPGRRSLWS